MSLECSFLIAPSVFFNVYSWLITAFVTRLTRRVPLVEQELLTLPKHMSSPRVTRPLVLCVMFCRSLFVHLSFFFWPLCCLFFFESRILITPLVSSNSSCPCVSFLLAIVLSVFLRVTNSDYLPWYLQTFLIEFVIMFLSLELLIFIFSYFVLLITSYNYVNFRI